MSIDFIHVPCFWGNATPKRRRNTQEGNMIYFSCTRVCYCFVCFFRLIFLFLSVLRFPALSLFRSTDCISLIASFLPPSLLSSPTHCCTCIALFLAFGALNGSSFSFFSFYSFIRTHLFLSLFFLLFSLSSLFFFASLPVMLSAPSTIFFSLSLLNSFQSLRLTSPPYFMSVGH